MDRKLLTTLLAYTGLLGGLYLLFVILRPFLPAIGWAAVIAIATYPVYTRLLQRLDGRSTVAASVMTVIVFLVILVPTTVVLALLVGEVVTAEQAIAAAIERGQFTSTGEILNHPLLAPWIERITGWANLADIDLKATLATGAKAILAWMVGSFGAILKNMALFVFQLFLIVVALFFVYRDGMQADKAFWAALPLSPATRRRLRDTTRSVVKAVVSGVLVTAAVQAVVAAFGYWFVGLPSVILLGALSFLAAFIPVVGVGLIWVPAALYLFFTGQTMYAVLLVGWGALVVSTIDSVLRPLLISGKTGLPLSLMMLGALGGLIAFGFFGLVVGPLAIAIALVVVDAARR
jgi:predicted PurR-regulated permease PerM